MSDPKPYDLSKPEEMLRLVHEVYGYLHTSLEDGTDREGRCHALNALRSIEKSDPRWASCLAACAAILHRNQGAFIHPSRTPGWILEALERAVKVELEGARPAPWPEPNCRTCLYGVVARDAALQDAHGYCRRFPHQERIRPEHWCGEHRPRVVVDE